MIQGHETSAPKTVPPSLPVVSPLTSLEVIPGRDSTSADSNTPEPQPHVHPPLPPPPQALMDHSAHKHTLHTAEGLFSLSPPQPAASSDRKPQFPLLLLLLWASSLLFLIIPLFSALILFLTFAISTRSLHHLPFIFLLSLV